MAKTPKEQMEEAITRAKEEVADEVKDHKAEDQDLEDVVGGVASDADTLWEVGVIYKT
ncbi:MAG: hypothetical protein ABIS20_06240 [Thermoanaerobaculia bacterium]